MGSADAEDALGKRRCSADPLIQNSGEYSQEQQRSTASYITRNVFVGFLAAALGGLLFGYIIGLSSGIITENALLCPKGQSGASWTENGYDLCYSLSSLSKGLMTSLNLIGALISTLFCFKFGDRLGRHRELSISSVLFTIGALVTAFAPSLVVVMAGFLIYGFGIGFAMHAAPVYISEISHEKARGLLVSSKEAMIVVGILLGYSVSAAFQHVKYNWRWMIASACVFSITLGIFLLTQKRSPRWLAVRASKVTDPTQRRELMDESLASLRHFRTGYSEEAVRAEADEIFEAVGLEYDGACRADESADDLPWTHVFKYSRALIIGCGLVIFQQVTGQPSVLYYANNIFKSAGFGDNSAVASVAVAVVKLVATVFSMLKVDQYGRRFMLFTGISLMLAALVVLAVGFSYQTCSDAGTSVKDCSDDDLKVPGAWGVTTVLALMVYVSGYQVGFGPVNWLIISEIFPLSIRGAAFSVAAGANFGSNILIAFVFEQLQTWLTTPGTYALYAGLSVLAIVFVYFLVPETKGKSLEDIERLLGYRPPAGEKDYQLRGA